MTSGPCWWSTPSVVALPEVLGDMQDKGRVDASRVYNRVRRLTVQETLVGHAGEKGCVGRGDPGTTLTTCLPG